MKHLKLFFVFVLVVFSSVAKGPAEKIVNYRLTEYAAIKLDTIESQSSLKVDVLMYLGPPAIDIDDSGFIYILNSDNNSIGKFTKEGILCWNIHLNEQILDIHAWRGEFFTFNGRTVFIYSITNGSLIDSINIGLKEDDVTAVGNVSKFYGGFLLINKWPVFKKEQLYILDLSYRKVSPKIPNGVDLYPVFGCSACSLSFVKAIFDNQGYNFIDQSDKYIAYIRSNEKREMFPNIYLLNKSSGEKQMITNIPFFKSLSFMSIRYCKFITSSEIVCCTIERNNFTPKCLKFYKISF